MPFQSTQLGVPLPGDATIKVFFYGLLILRASSDSKFCVVETLRDVTNPPHILSVEVRTKVPGKPDAITMRHFGQLKPLDSNDPEGPGMTIEVVNPTPSPTVFKHQPSATFDPVLGSGQPNDFQWILDLQKLHSPRVLSVDPRKTRPSIMFLNGLYHFHTADRKEGGVEIKQGGVLKATWRAIASIVGANISLPNGSSLFLKWNDGSQINELYLSNPEGGATHEIYIDNSPLYVDPSESVAHGELEKYYDVITPTIPEDERYSLKFLDETVAIQGQADRALFVEGSAKYNTLLMTPRIPCQPVVLEG